MTPATPPPPTTLTARSPEDVLAMVPVLLGFVPEESVAMLTLGPGRSFHARADLPDARSPCELDEMVAQLLGPVRQHGVGRVLLVLYSTDELLATRAARALARELEGAGVELVHALRADGSRWYPALGPRAGAPASGVPYDLTAHPFLAQAALEGRVLLRTREELRATVAGDPDAVARVVAALAALPGSRPPGGVVWARALVEGHVAAGTFADDREVARLLRAVLDPRVRDATWRTLGRGTAAAHVRFWSDVLRRTPEPLVAAPAAVLALAAWQSGHGALAWCALDRCADAGRRSALADFVTEVLLGAVPPDCWPPDGPTAYDDLDELDHLEDVEDLEELEDLDGCDEDRRG